MMLRAVYLIVLAALSFVRTEECSQDEKLCRNWPNWGSDLQNHRSSGNSAINVSNARNLRLEWMTSVHGNVFSTPTIYDGVVFVLDDAGYIYALEEATGKKVWEKNLANFIERSPTGRPVWARSAPAVYKNLIIFGIYGPAYSVALERATGALVWRTKLDNHPWAQLTMSPTIENGIVYQGVSSLEELAAAYPDYPCCSFAGSMNALNADTGAIIWKTSMIPAEDVGVGKYAGCSVWGSSPPVDANNVYIATGNLYTVPDNVAECVTQCTEHPETCVGKPTCVPENIHFDSILALNKATGEIVWSRRLETADAWTVACLFGLPTNCPIPTGPDFDFAQAPIIFGKDGLIVGQKSGVVWGLNRLTGEVRWSNAVDQGGVSGGFMWGGSLSTDKHGVQTWIGASANSENKPTTFPNGFTSTGSSIVAIDPLTGKTKWCTAVPPPAHSNGAVSSTTEVAFAPAFETGIMTAYSIKDGKPLWSFQTNATLHGGPSISGKRIFFGNGYQPLFGGTVGRNVYCFKAHDDHC